MRRYLRWLLLPLLLAGCVTPSSRVDYSYLESAHGVDPVLTAKMQSRLPLDVSDIAYLAEKQVPDPVVLDYLGRRRAVYQLDSSQVESLLESGVSRQVVDYMLSTSMAVQRVYVHPYYWHGPYPLFRYRMGWHPYW